MSRNYEDDLKVGDDLEAEWVEQPSNYMYYAERWADAVELRDRRKQRLEVVHAETDARLRKTWERITDQKMTEPAIKARILTDPAYKKAQSLLNKANHSVNILASAKTAFEHKKKALENNVTLLVTGFHAEPRTSKALRGIKQTEGHKQRKQSLNRTRKRKTRKT